VKDSEDFSAKKYKFSLFGFSLSKFYQVIYILLQIKPSLGVIKLIAYFELLFMKRSKTSGMCKAAESWFRDSQLFLEKLVSKNSIQLIFLSKTILRSAGRHCPSADLLSRVPLLR